MLQKVKPEQLSADDFASLYVADRNGPAFNSISPPDLVKQIWAGELLVYRLEDRGVILFEINIGGDGSKRLNIVRFAGENLALVFQQISNDLQHIARENGCDAIETCVYCPRLARALTRCNAREESITMVLEVSDG